MGGLRGRPTQSVDVLLDHMKGRPWELSPHPNHRYKLQQVADSEPRLTAVCEELDQVSVVVLEDRTTHSRFSVLECSTAYLGS